MRDATTRQLDVYVSEEAVVLLDTCQVMARYAAALGLAIPTGFATRSPEWARRRRGCSGCGPPWRRSCRRRR